MTLISIAAGGVAKSLVAVTISLHPGAAQPAGHDITVQRGDSLSAISLHEYGTAAEWPALWWANRRQVPDPSMIVPGERLIVPSGLRASRWLVRAEQAATAAPRRAAAAAVARTPSGASVSSGAEVADTVAAGARRATPSGAAPGSFRSCVIQRESSGNPRAVNPSSGAGGLYGFLPSTWHGLGFSGLPENASVAEQNYAFAKEYAQSGTSAWAPYDGC
jgi:soluble lytic murein transglycosylase-like protein